MAELKMHTLTGIRRFMEATPVETSRIWICTTCGAKVFYGRMVPLPNYRCLCGGRQWKSG